MRLSTSNFAHILKTKIKQNIVSKVLHFLDLSQLPLRALTAASKTLIKCILVVRVGQSQTEDYHRQKSGATLLNLGRHREKMKALRSNFRYITTKQIGPAWQEIREDYGRKRNEEKAFAFYSVLPPILFQSWSNPPEIRPGGQRRTWKDWNGVTGVGVTLTVKSRGIPGDGRKEKGRPGRDLLFKWCPQFIFQSMPKNEKWQHVGLTEGFGKTDYLVGCSNK